MEWNGGMENGMKRWMYATKVTHVHVTGTVQSSSRALISPQRL